MIKYRMVIDGERMSDMLAIAQLAEEKNLSFHGVNEIENGLDHAKPKAKKIYNGKKSGLQKLLVSKMKVGDLVTEEDFWNWSRPLGSSKNSMSSAGHQLCAK